jgi:hypothetical protein
MRRLIAPSQLFPTTLVQAGLTQERDRAPFAARPTLVSQVAPWRYDDRENRGNGAKAGRDSQNLPGMRVRKLRPQAQRAIQWLSRSRMALPC